MLCILHLGFSCFSYQFLSVLELILKFSATSLLLLSTLPSTLQVSLRTVIVRISIVIDVYDDRMIDCSSFTIIA